MCRVFSTGWDIQPSLCPSCSALQKAPAGWQRAPQSPATSLISHPIQPKRRTHFRFISSNSYQLVHWNGLSSLTRSALSHHATRKAIITILLELLGGNRLPRRVQRFLSRKASSRAGMFCKPRGSERAAERSLNSVKPAKEIQ